MTSTLRIDIHVGKKLQLNFYKSVRYHALYTFFLRLFINFHEFFPLFHSKIFFDRIHSLYFYIFSSLPYPVKTNVLKYNSNSSFFLFLFFNKIYIYIYIVFYHVKIRTNIPMLHARRVVTVIFHASQAQFPQTFYNCLKAADKITRNS